MFIGFIKFYNLFNNIRIIALIDFIGVSSVLFLNQSFEHSCSTQSSGSISSFFYPHSTFCSWISIKILQNLNIFQIFHRIINCMSDIVSFIFDAFRFRDFVIGKFFRIIRKMQFNIFQCSTLGFWYNQVREN